MTLAGLELALRTSWPHTHPAVFASQVLGLPASTTVPDLFLFFWGRVSCSSCWPPIHYVIKDDLKLLVLLPPSFDALRPQATMPDFIIFRIKPRTSCMLSKHSTSWATYPALFWVTCQLDWTSPADGPLAGAWNAGKNRAGSSEEGTISGGEGSLAKAH